MKKIIVLLALFCSQMIMAQTELRYQVPPKEIMDLVDVPLAPGVNLDSEGENVILFFRDPYKSIAELSETEMRLAGLRINPATNIGSRTNYYNNLKVKKATGKNIRQVQGLPDNARLANFKWSPNQKMMAFTHTTSDRVEVWVMDIEKAEAKRLSEAAVNANMGNPIEWFKNGEALLVRMLPLNRKMLINTDEAVPGGPVISVSTGEKAQNRTYQDLLKNPADESNFEQLAYSELHKVALDGTSSQWIADMGMYNDVSFSPDGNFVLVNKVQRPFSYLVPYYRFAGQTTVYNKAGQVVQVVNTTPLTEVLPKGFMAVREGRRNIGWRSDKPSTLYWAQALDGGDPDVEVDYRDEVFMLEAPFSGTPISMLKIKNRFGGITWGNSTVAIAYDYWWNNRNTKTYLFNPSTPGGEMQIISDRNYQDRYSDPGSFATHRNEFNERALLMQNNKAYLLGDGFSEKGQFPFVDEFDLKSRKVNRLYQSSYINKKEDIRDVIDPAKGKVLVRIESSSDYPNYYFRDINKKDKLTTITSFENPFKSIQNVHKEVIKYKREDGLELEATLYLPAGYDKNKKEKLPMVLWAYPREFKDKNSASQNTSNPNDFTYPYYGSPVYWVTRGYVVLDDAAFPIIGEGDEEPNDSFRKQLVANAKAAIDAVDDLGYIDRKRVAVGGHSYGAFMVANLLSHSDLFAAGIARSGAYNRTLTPFGFQSEERSYWEAPEVYNSMSPFMHADKMKTPLLLIHGEADNNSGTYPLQSERYFNALKGLGAPARLVMLPKESHGYRAKESILHLLWEQDEWLEKYVKNKGDETSASSAE